MRTLIITRGLPGSGKSTFIKNNKLSQFVISSDQLVPMLSSPMYDTNGNFMLDKETHSKTWALIFQMLEIRMQRGEFTIIDATHTKGGYLTKYRKLAEEYRYRLYILDFTNIDINICKKRNALRTGCEYVSETIIDNMYQNLLKEPTEKIKKGFEVINVLDNGSIEYKGEIYSKLFDLFKVQSKKIDLSDYEKIHIIGDTHGCYTAFNNWFKSIGGYNKNEAYIFLGDYFDKGIENVEMFKFISNFSKSDNVFCLEGNHEKHLWDWARGKSMSRCKFAETTSKEFEAANITQRDARRFYRSLWQYGVFSYYNAELICTHGGYIRIPTVLTSTKSVIFGTGTYEDARTVDNSFSYYAENLSEYTGKKYYSFHGHRNVTGEPIRVNENAFNLEGQVELGGCLRTVTISYNEKTDKVNFQTTETPNDIFGINDALINVEPTNIKNVVKIMRACEKHIKERKFGDISSFNFSRQAFNKAIWNNITVKARGLFINIKTNEIVLRSYDKFFKINETEETKIENLEKNLCFPITAYRKENGFLGLLGWDKEKNDFLFATKGSLDGLYVDYFKNVFFKQFKNTPTKLKEFKKYLRNCDGKKTFVFEVIDPENDPHIIHYNNPKIILLDVIFNDISFKNERYSCLKDYQDNFGFEIKEEAGTFNNWSEFSEWYLQKSKDYNNQIEGYVIQDSNGFHFKVKTEYYNFWKQCRNIVESVKKYGSYNRISTMTWGNEFLDALVKEFYDFIMTKNERQKLENTDIITLRYEFFDNLSNEAVAKLMDLSDTEFVLF